MKCSFCEQPLVCQACHQPFRPKTNETHLSLYQPDKVVSCPECHKVLICRACGFVFGEDSDEAPPD